MRFPTLILSAAVAASCQFDSQSESKQESASWYQNPIQAIKSTFRGTAQGEADMLRVLGLDGEELARFDAGSCLADPEKGAAKVLLWKIRTVSAFGESTVRLDTPVLASQPILLQIDGLKYSLNHEERIPLPMAEQFCQALQHGERSYVVASQQLSTIIKGWLHASAPDCDYQVPSVNQPWQCQISYTDPELALAELQSMKRTMLRRWSRQPYLLTRKVTLAERLASLTRTSNEDDSEVGLDNFCKVISYSDPKELTWTFRSERWRGAVCRTQENSRRLEAARIGLSKSLQEIELMRQLTESTSKLGLLQLKIPNGDVPTKDLQVSLIPTSEVARNVAVASANLDRKSSAKNKKTNGSDDRDATSCWHPLFSESSLALHRARLLDLVGESHSSSCTPLDIAIEDSAYSTHQYLAENITSETKFVITNGRSKLLRLPSGTYTYSIRDQVNDFNEWDSPPSKTPAIGTISWDSRRPNVTISSW